MVLSLGLVFSAVAAPTGPNLLKNPGFEETAAEAASPPGWDTAGDSEAKAIITGKEAHQGQKAIAIPANTSIEQSADALDPGAYLARCWIKSESEQYVTFQLRDAARPWAAYTCAEIRVPGGKWTQIETFCPLDRKGSLTLSLGGVSKEFHPYHGTSRDMSSPIIADDFELVRFQANASSPVTVWEVYGTVPASFDWSARNNWTPINSAAHNFSGTPVIRGGHLAGMVRQSDGGLAVYSLQDTASGPRCVIVPSPALPGSRCTMVQENGRTGLRVSANGGDGAYTAWFTPEGLISIEASHIPQFQVRDCHLQYGLLPSFIGTDLCYTPADLPGTGQFHLPSTQWFVGLVNGNNSMLVAAWQTNRQSACVSAAGAPGARRIDTLAIGTQIGGFSLSFIDHPGIWHAESLNEDWLGEYVPVSWERPFPARWMAHLFVTTGGRSTFRDPGIGYSFPIAAAKTRMWGVWFEDWNHYPFFFDGARTVFHFEKTFVPQGIALLYFLEPAAADISSPVEIVEQALGREQAQDLFDLDGNQLRKLKYSTPDQFMFDRPVCATTTRLSKIKAEEKPTVGVNLATHLYEFIEGIRGRVDEYTGFFAQTKSFLEAQQKEHPELQEYAGELEKLIAEAQSHATQIYATPLSAVQTKIENMKVLLREGKGDGFNCGDLDVRSPAGAQDDLCRRYNRVVLKLTQTAALKCGDSPEKAAIATYIWEQSRQLLRRPTRWEPRRTLYFFEP